MFYPPLPVEKADTDAVWRPPLPAEEAIVLPPSVVDDDGFELVKAEDLSPAPPPSTTLKRELSEVKAGLENLVILLAFDTTASMFGPINSYGKYAALAVIAALKASVGEQRCTVHVEVHIVGLNDWHCDSGGGVSQPCRLFAEREEPSEEAGKPVGIEFDVDSQSETETDKHIALLQKAIEEVAQHSKDGRESGGDLAEEYGVGIDLLTHIVTDCKSRYPDDTTRYFCKVLTDAATHGIAHPSHEWFGFHRGVTEEALYGNAPYFPKAHAYKCKFAPYTVHGFPCWKPVSLLDALNKLLDQQVMVAWVTVGDSAKESQYQLFRDWLGTLAAVLEAHDNGFLIRWDADRAREEERKRKAGGTSDPYSIGVPGVIRHIFTSVLTSASAEAMAATVSDARKAEGLKEFFEAQDRAYVASLPPSSQAATASLEDYGQTVQQCEVSSDLTESLNRLFMRGITSDAPDATDEDMATGAALGGEEGVKVTPEHLSAVRKVQESKGSSKDAAAAAAYRSLSSEPMPPPATPTHFLERDDVDDPEDNRDGPPTFFGRSLTALPVAEEMAEEEGYEMPFYRSLTGGAPPMADKDAFLPCYRGLAETLAAEAPRLTSRKYGDAPPRLRPCKTSGTDRLLSAACSLTPVRKH